MFVPSLIFKQLGECLRLACCALLMLLTSQAAAIQSTITVVADRGPIDVGGRATFTAHVQPTTYRVCTAVGYDLSTFQTVYVRYDIPGSTFLQNVSFSDLADVMTSANVANDIIVQGGTPADNFVVFQVVAGTAGMPASDLFCFRLPGVNFGTGNPNPYVAYSLHLSAISAAGPNPVNTTRASVYGPVDLGVFASTPAPSGAVMFEVDSAPVPGCTAQPVVSGGASCTITFGITGVHVVVANYSGDGAYSGSLGALAGGQTVNIVLPSAVPDGIVGSLYFFAVVATGAAPNPVFSLSAGSLPPGLSLSPTGVLSGVPAAIGSFNISISVLDINGMGRTQAYTLQISPTVQAIDFTLPVSGRVGTQLILSATANSGLPVVYTVDTPQVCDMAGAVLRLLSVGTCSVTAMQPGDGQHSAAAAVTRTMFVLLSTEPTAIRLRSAAGLPMVGRLLNGQFQFTADANPDPGFRLLGSVDFDGDGSPDLLYLNTNQGSPGEVHLWRKSSSTNDVVLRSVKFEWDVQAIGDLDGDGFGDLVWRYTATGSPDTGVSYVWFGSAGGVAEVRKRGGAPLDWRLAGARDLNGDGAADMVYINPAGQVRVLMATAARSCANFSAGSLPAGFGVVHFADYSGSQRGELLLQNVATGELKLLSLDARGLVLPPSTANPNDPNASCTATTANISTALLNLPVVPADWTYFASADVNGDGISDIVWRGSDGTLIVWLMGAGGVSSVIANAGSAPAGSAVFQP